MSVLVQLIVRESCGSCRRVQAQIEPLCAGLGATFAAVDADRAAEAGDSSWALEFGDRLPVVLVNGEEIAAWEVDDADLFAAIEAAR